jgi:type II secretory pathway pseudopilin PulG
VVIGIIAILAGVALGPITNGIKKAKQSAGLQTAHSIGLALYSFANDNQQTYPDTGVPTGNSGTGAMAAVQPLLAGGYVTDPSIFYISGGTATKYSGTASSAATSMTATNISWDFGCQSNGQGLNSSNYQYMPILWSSVAAGGGVEPQLGSAGTVSTAVTATPGSGNPYGTAGMAVFYISNSAQFITSSLQGGTPQVVIIQAANNLGGAPGDASVLKGGG